MNLLCLTQDAIRELCPGLTQPAAIVRHLRSQGFVRARLEAGTVVLERAHYEAVCRGLITHRPKIKSIEFGPTPPIPHGDRSKAYWENLRKTHTPKPKKKKRRELVNFHANKRRADKIKRTPPWADLEAIKAVYQKCEEMRKSTGIRYAVDHVTPLNGRLVSGLHVAGNLQIITASENSRKKNHFKP